MQQNSIRWWTVIIGVLLWMSPVSDLSAYRTILMNLEDLATRAPRIVAGLCTSRNKGKVVVGTNGGNLAYTEYTFRVTDVIKGKVGDPLIIRQVNLGRKPMSEAQGSEETTALQPVPRNPLPLPDYQPGQEVFLFLTEDSKLGLTSPLGIQQGVFDIETARGEKLVSSRVSNTTLLRGISPERKAALGLFARRDPIPPRKAAETTAGPFGYEAFVSLVKELSEGR